MNIYLFSFLIALDVFCIMVTLIMLLNLFIKEFKDVVNWNWISAYQKLSEDFIGEFKDVVYWDLISEYQKLSEDFIKEFKDYVNWELLEKHQKHLKIELVRKVNGEIV